MRTHIRRRRRKCLRQRHRVSCRYRAVIKLNPIIISGFEEQVTVPICSSAVLYLNRVSIGGSRRQGRHSKTLAAGKRKARRARIGSYGNWTCAKSGNTCSIRYNYKCIFVASATEIRGYSNRCFGIPRICINLTNCFLI